MKKIYFFLSFAVISCTVFSQTWKTIAPMNYIRGGQILVTLGDGTILTAGGWDATTGNNHQNAEVYDPVQDKWIPVGDMSATRYGAKAVVLNNGKVLIAGGYNKACGCDLKTAELYDPVSKTFTPTGSMSIVRYAHTMTLMKDGRVLVTGGTDGVCSCFLESAEAYDPVMGTWSDVGVMSQDREFHTATLLDNGKVLITGGNNWNDFQVNTTDIFDPTDDSWSTGPVMFYKRDQHAAVKLADGKVLVTGGRRFEYSTTSPTYEAHYSSIFEAEILDAAGTAWTLVTDPMSPGMSYHRMILLNDGSVLTVAGVDSSTSKLMTTPSVTQKFNPVNETWKPEPMTDDSRFEMEAAKMKDGRVIVCGGKTGGCEIYDGTTGINEKSKINSIAVYPNPASELIQFEIGGHENSSVALYNSMGEKVLMQYLPPGTVSLSISEYSPGIYFLKIESAEQVYTEKITLIR